MLAVEQYHGDRFRKQFLGTETQAETVSETVSGTETQAETVSETVSGAETQAEIVSEIMPLLCLFRSNDNLAAKIKTRLPLLSSQVLLRRGRSGGRGPVRSRRITFGFFAYT